MGATEKVQSKLHPGPGSHDLPSFPDQHPSLLSSCSYSMGGTCATNSKADRLGPGSHHPKWCKSSTYKRSPGYGFGKERRPFIEQSPRRPATTPHAQLEQGDHSTFKGTPKFSFGSTERVPPYQTCVGMTLKDKFVERATTHSHGTGEKQRGARRPDPGTYDVDDLATSRMSSSPAYSVSSRRDSGEGPLKNSADPGPGSYASEECGKSIYKAAPRAKFSTAPRGVSERLPSTARTSRSVPGPGQYLTQNCTRTGDIANKSSPAWPMPSRPEFDPSLYIL